MDYTAAPVLGLAMVFGEKRRNDLPRAVILTAISEEYRAVRSFLDDLKRVKHPDGTIYQRGSFTSDDKAWEVIIAEIGAGNAGAAVEAERAIQFFKPDIVAFVGVAGGLKDVRIGDVVAATKVYGYEAGKAKEDFQTRPEVFRSSYSLEQEARAAVNDDLWHGRLKTRPDALPKAFVAPIAAGEKVVASTYSDVWTLIKQSYGDALAVEMEGAGFLRAIHANQRVQAIIVRGISDLVDEKEKADATGSQTLAAERAAAFMFEVLANLEHSPSEPSLAASVPDIQPELSISTHQELVSPKQQTTTSTKFSIPIKKEKLYSNLLPLSAFPSRLFVGECHYYTKQELWADLRKIDSSAQGVCSLRSGQIYSFADLRSTPWNTICDQGTVECFSTDEWADADELERRWLFVELMNGLLREALYTRGVVYDKIKELYYFKGDRLKIERKWRYFSKKRMASCDVVKAYKSDSEPKYVKYYRHHACRTKFELIEERWHLRITPTYFYTSDGKNRSQFHESLLKGIKQQEGNGAVLGQVVMWANLMPSPSLYDQEGNLFCFDGLLTFETEFGVFDPAWLKGESKKKKDLYDTSQQQLDFWDYET